MLFHILKALNLLGITDYYSTLYDTRFHCFLHNLARWFGYNML